MLSIFTNEISIVFSGLILQRPDILPGCKFKNLLLVDSNNNNSKGVSYTSGFFMLIGLALLGLTIGTILTLPIWTAMTGKSIASLPTEMNNPANANAIRIMQVVSVLIGFLLPAYFVAFFLNKKPLALLGFKKPTNWKQVGLVLLIMAVSLFIAGGFGYINQKIPVSASWKTYFDKLEKNYMQQVAAMIGGKNGFADYIIGLLLMAFLPALCEETFFRGGLQNFLTRATKKPWLSIFIISFLFSAVHFSFYGFLPRMFLGVTLGAIYYYTQNLWLSVLAHFFNNALAISELYFYSNAGKDIKNLPSDQMPVYWALFAIPLFILLILRLKKTTRPSEYQLHQN